MKAEQNQTDAFDAELLDGLSALAAEDAVLFVAPMGAGVFRAASAAAGPVSRPPLARVADWRALGWVAAAGPVTKGAQKLRITAAGRRALAQAQGFSAQGLSAPVRQAGDQPVKSAPGNEPRAEGPAAAQPGPIAALARRRGPDGAAYLRPIEVAAAGRLAAEHERGLQGAPVTQNWDRFKARVDAQSGGGPQLHGADARRSVDAALADLGPGLSDVAYRVCCLEQGVETVEKSLGWPARSGKLVLKLALARLADHFGMETTASDKARRIGVWRAHTTKACDLG